MTLTKAQQFDAIRELLVAALAIKPESIVAEARIMDDLNAESIDLLDLRFRLERAFHLKITAGDLAQAFRGAEDASQFRARFTVGALCDYIAARVASSEPPV